MNILKLVLLHKFISFREFRIVHDFAQRMLQTNLYFQTIILVTILANGAIDRLIYNIETNLQLDGKLLNVFLHLIKMC